MLFLFVVVISLLSCITTSTPVDDVFSNLYNQLYSYGPSADGIEYMISSQNHKNLSMKIWVQLNHSLRDSSKSLLTVVRLDNRLTDFGLTSRNKRFSLDSVWEDIQGWEEDLNISLNFFKKSSFNIKIPSQKDFSIYQREIDFKASGKISKKKVEFPKIIHQLLGDTSMSIPPIVRKLSQLLTIKNPSWKMMAKKLDELGDMILELEGQRVFNAYMTLQPIAYKADLYRLVALYHYGGVYLDSKMVLLKKMEDFLPQNGGAFIPYDAGFKNIQGAMLAFPIKDPFLRAAIDQIVLNVENRFYGNGFLSPTGPALLEDVWVSKGFSLLPSYRKLAIHSEGYIKSIDDDSNICLFHNSEYRRVGYSTSLCHYANQYKRRTIYNEKKCAEIRRKNK